MNNVELYIGGKLCDTGKSFGVRLNRQLLNPSELNAKDAQYSYSVTLPPTAANNAAFSYSIIEETKDKFNRLYVAELYVNSIRVFKGNFKLSEISEKQYKGNLYIPAAKSIKDIFDDLKLAENPEYRIEFKDFAEYVTRYNKNAANGPQMAIFPYVLYSVIPKVPADTKNNYSDRNTWDDTVRMGIWDLAPSVNPLLMLKHIFNSRGYKLGGTAFDDERLAHLYMSYKNESNYVQPWNYGIQARMHLRGEWSNVYNKRSSSSSRQFERSVYESSPFDNGRSYYSSDLFDANNTKINIIENPGGSIKYKEINDENARTWVNTQVMIPASGFYKVQLRASFKVYNNKNWRDTDPVTGVQFVSGYSGKQNNNFNELRYEIKVLRDWKAGDFGLNAARNDNVFYTNNFAQNKTFDTDNNPKYFPQIQTTPSGKPCQIQFVDISQNRNHVCGLSWGYNSNAGKNPKDLTSVHASCSVQKPSLSWDVSANDTEIPRLAVNSPGFWKWGWVGKYDNDDDDIIHDPDTEGSEYIDGILGYELSNKHKIVLEGSPENYARRGYYEGANASQDWNGDGAINAIVWFNAGELITLVVTTDEGAYRKDDHMHSRYGYTNCETKFDLSITPYRIEPDWLKVNTRGNGTDPMSWNDPITFDTDTIDLVKFLPADVKVDDFIENFCKAFNLKLSQTALDAFSLDVKQTKAAVSPLFINLDSLASVHDRANSPLGLPSMYKIGFTVDQEEEGYVMTGDDGGGSFETGAVEESIVEQKSNFSYNWFKDINYTVSGANTILPIPVISKAEVWADTMPYPDAMAKRYTSLAARFWYFDGLLNDLGADFQFNNNKISLAKVSNTITGLITLNYKDEVNTILDVYFTVLVNSSSHYTELAGYLTPEQYEQLDGSIMAMFNGDQYYVAEISGYDPLSKNMTKIKLIRKI